jgi:hypothetical protein
MTSRITREDLERRLGGDLTFELPFIGKFTVKQGLGVLAVVVVVIARFVLGRRTRVK